MRRPPTCLAIPHRGTGRDEALVAIRARFAEDATFMIRSLIVERRYDADLAVEVYTQWATAIVEDAVAIGVAKLGLASRGKP